MRRLSTMIATILVLSQTIGCTGRTANDTGAPAEPANTVEAPSRPALSSEDSPSAQAGEAQAKSDAESTPASENTAVAQQYQALLAEYEAEGGARIFAKRFLELAKQNPRDAAAIDPLLWIVSNVPGKAETTRALELLRQHHVQSDQLGPACKPISESRSLAAEKLLRAIVEENPAENVRALACYHLASLLDLETTRVEQLKSQPELAPRVLQYYGKEYGEHLASLEVPELEKQREQLYEKLRDAFPNVELDGVAMGELAEKMLYRIRHLSVGKVAPEIDGEDIAGNRFKLSDYRGKVVMLTFWGHW